MHAKTIVELIVLAIVVLTGIALLPDFLRYLKMRSM